MIQVILIDDHPSVRLGLKELLRASGISVVGEAATAVEGIAVAERTRPTLAIVDLRLPDGDGAVLCRAIRTRFPNVACLVYSGGDDPRLIADAVLGGANGVVFKGSPTSELISAIEIVAGGGEFFAPELSDQLVESFRARSRPGQNDKLSEQEEKILSLLADGLSNQEIADRLELAEKTVRNHVSSLLRKLGLRDRTQAALYAQRRA